MQSTRLRGDAGGRHGTEEFEVTACPDSGHCGPGGRQTITLAPDHHPQARQQQAHAARFRNTVDWWRHIGLNALAHTADNEIRLTCESWRRKPGKLKA